MHSSALTLGRWDVTAVIASYGAMLAILLGLGLWRSFPWPYYAGLGVAAALTAWHWHLIRHRTREGCWRAFMNANWIGVAILGGFVFSLPLWLPLL